MQLNDLQKTAIKNPGNTLVIGAPGTGKTTIIVTKIKMLIDAGVKPESIAIACFTRSSVAYFKSLLPKYIGQDAKRVHYSTFNELSITELKAAKLLEGTFASTTQMRRLLHQARAATEFKGSVHEAEHIIRSFKSKPKKPTEKDEHYALFKKYQDLLHSRKWYDRFDTVRQHLIAMRNGVANPARIKHLFVDNGQDINQLQLLWVLEHAMAGIKLNICIDDDQCIFERSGVLGSKVIDNFLESEVKFEKILLNTSYRMTKNLSKMAYSIVELADQRYSKPELAVLDYNSKIEIKSYNSKSQELLALIANINAVYKAKPNAKIGVITRNDDSARIVSRYLHKSGLTFSDFSRDIWEMPGAIVIVDLLEVIMGSGEIHALKSVFSKFGLKSRTIDALFESGIDSKSWLENGAKINKKAIEDEEELRKIVKIQAMFNSYYAMRVKLPIKDIFKALCFEMMKNMSSPDKKDALIAIEKVLSFKGDMKSNISKVRSSSVLVVDSPLSVGPVREFRNLEFDVVFMPLVNPSFYPCDYKVLGKKNSSDRRLFFTAMTRAKGNLFISYANTPSTYIKKMI